MKHSWQGHRLGEVRPCHVQVRIISLDPEDTMKVLGVQAVQSTPESLLLLDSPLVGASGTEEGRGVGALFLHIGQPLSHVIKFADLRVQHTQHDMLFLQQVVALHSAGATGPHLHCLLCPLCTVFALQQVSQHVVPVPTHRPVLGPAAHMGNLHSPVSNHLQTYLLGNACLHTSL